MLILKKSVFFTTALISSMAFSGTMGEIENTAPFVGYVGLGAGYNSIDVNNRLYAFGTSNTYIDGVLTTYGAAGGNSTPLPHSQTKFAPQIQIGFNRYFSERKDFWGIKAIYQYLSGHAVTYNVPVTQIGSYTDTGAGRLPSDTFSGNVVVESAQVNTNHQINLFGLVGHTFSNWNVYLGAGPTVFGMQSKIENAYPFANIDGISTSQSDYAIGYSRSTWVWGGGAQLGMTYAFSPSWFLDFNYTYAAAPSTTVHNPFRAIGKSPTAVFNLTTSSSGTLYVNSTQAPSVQTFSITVNKTF